MLKFLLKMEKLLFSFYPFSLVSREYDEKKRRKKTICSTERKKRSHLNLVKYEWKKGFLK